MLKSIQSTVADMFDNMNKMSLSENSLLGYSTSFTEIDIKTSGLQNGQLIVVAGRPSIGKSSFVTNLAESIIFNNQIPTLFFSFESNAETIAMRIISSYAKINNNHLKFAKLDNEEWSKVVGAILQLQEQNFSICDDPALSLEDIGTHISNFCTKNENAFIVVDDIQRIKPKKSIEGKMTRSDELTETSRYLKELAQKFNVPIIIVSQLNRNLENRPNKRPIISDLRDCGAIEDNADLIMFIYRDEVYNKESKEAGTAEIIIGKQRNGPIGSVRLAFEGQYTRFSNLSPEYYSQYDDEE